MVDKVGDITAEELIAEYGLNEEQAMKLMQSLPILCKEMATQAEGGGKLPAPGAQPGYPYPVAPSGDQMMYPHPYPYPYPMMPAVPQLTPEMLQAILMEQQMMANPYPLIDAISMDFFEKMSDEQVEEALKFIDSYIVSKDTYPSPARAGMRPGAAVGYRWPKDEMARALASLILFGSTEMAQTKAPQKDPAKPPITQRNESFWGRVFQKRDAMDKLTAGDSSAADSILPPPFFYEDEFKVDVDKSGIVIQDGILKAPVSAAAAMVQEYTIDGKKVMVLKDPKELKAAADCARMLPITNDHPPQRIVTDQKEIKGWTDLIKYDEESEKIKTAIEVKDEKTIKDIQDGKDNVSIGFMCDLEYTPGKWGDIEYDAVQRNIVLNHLAIVDKGRCPTGKCGIGLDSKGAAIISDSAITEEDLIADAVKKGCPGGDGCECGLHKGLDTKKIEDACKTKKKDEKKKSDSEENTGDAKMKYMLKEKEGHTHTAELDKDGNGESTKEMDHIHKIEGTTCMEAGDPSHIHILEEMKAEEKKDEETKTEENTMDAASVHSALLKEKTSAITTMAAEIARDGATMSPEFLREKISAIQDIAWKLTDLVSVIRAKDIKVDAAEIDAALRVISDTKGIEKVINDVRSRHAVLVDEVMDFKPPFSREHIAAKDCRELEEMIKLLDSQSMITLPAENDSPGASHESDDSGSKGKNLTLALQRKANDALGIKNK